MSKHEEVKIRWEYEGKTDVINGTGAYFEERMLGYSGAAIVTLLMLYLQFTGYTDWTWWQLLIASYISFDLGGGFMSNSLNSVIRFYETPYKEGEGKSAKYLKNDWIYNGMHFHPLIVGLVFNNDWVYAIGWQVIFFGSLAVVAITPQYLKRPISRLLTLLAIIISLYFLQSVPGFEWFIPLIFIKMVMGHMVREEPYDKM